MPVILDRLPLPNISWYTGISLFCLLCSVYYAGVQVKLHPDWKEQLLLRQAAAANRADPPDRAPLFESEIDKEGQCFASEVNLRNQYKHDVISFVRSIEELCTKETFDDIVRSALYPSCYLRVNSVDDTFKTYIKQNSEKLGRGETPYKTFDYFRKCKLRMDRLLAAAKKKRLDSSKATQASDNKESAARTTDETEKNNPDNHRSNR